MSAVELLEVIERGVTHRLVDLARATGVLDSVIFDVMAPSLRWKFSPEEKKAQVLELFPRGVVHDDE